MLTQQKKRRLAARIFQTIAREITRSHSVQRQGDSRAAGFLREHYSSRPLNRQRLRSAYMEEETMDGLIYLVGLIVIILAILSFFGLR
jgi:predicted membrane channel-forming protein YqfA (hemolysin III family)